MRNLIVKATAIAGAALLVTACGGGADATANNTAGNYADDTLMGNDIGTVDAVNGTGNLGVGTDMNMTGTTGTTDLNTSTTTTTNTTTTDTGTTGTTNTTGGNTTGM